MPVVFEFHKTMSSILTSGQNKTCYFIFITCLSSKCCIKFWFLPPALMKFFLVGNLGFKFTIPSSLLLEVGERLSPFTVTAPCYRPYQSTCIWQDNDVVLVSGHPVLVSYQIFLYQQPFHFSKLIIPAKNPMYQQEDFSQLQLLQLLQKKSLRIYAVQGWVTRESMCQSMLTHRLVLA